MTVENKMDQKITPETYITGADFKDFYKNHWPGEDWYLDDVGFEIEDEVGKFTLPLTARVRLSDCGYLVWQGKNGDPHRSGEMFPFINFYIAYKKQKPHETVVAEVPQEKVAEVVAFLESVGATVPCAKSEAPRPMLLHRWPTSRFIAMQL